MKPIGLSLSYLGHLNSLFYANEMICFSIYIRNMFTDAKQLNELDVLFIFSIYAKLTI